MSVVKTVLNEDTLAAIPAMNAASRPVTAMPSTPLGSSSRISSGMASLYVRPDSFDPMFGTTTAATRPGIITAKTMKIFGKAAISGVRFAADRFFADSARCTSAKLVVQ